MRFRTLIVAMAVLSTYASLGPYNGFDKSQISDVETLAYSVFKQGDFLVDGTGFSGFVPFTLPTTPSSKVTHTGILPEKSTDLKQYTRLLGERAQKSTGFTTSITEGQLTNACPRGLEDGDGHETCQIDYFMKTENAIYEVDMSITRISVNQYDTVMIISTVKNPNKE